MGYNVSPETVSQMRKASQECLDRGLVHAAKWCSDLLLAVSEEKRRQSKPLAASPSFLLDTQPSSQTPQPVERDMNYNYGLQSQTAPWESTNVPYDPQNEAVLEEQEGDELLAARASFDAKEFHRASHHLKSCKSSKAKFLRLYSEYIASEKRALRDWHKLDNTRQQPAVPINESLETLLLAVKYDQDPWLLFLKALFLSRVSRREESLATAIQSIRAFPWNWSAWILLGSCVTDGEELSSVMHMLELPPDHPLIPIFQIKILNELHNPTEQELQLCETLLGPELFPGSLWLRSLKACALYHLHEFQLAEKEFERILATDPMHIEHIDVLSNILYVSDGRLKLSKLAHDFLALDKDRPEVCCLIGNHYSLRAEHEKAIKYFRRATQLDRTYLPAWTLMGHEYVEMKNSHAAIEAYRRAVDVNRKDYRAWYGLGQAYELLSMHNYALHYYQRATGLRPYDVRLWQAQGMCYEEIGRLREAVECYKRALIPADPHEIVINLKLARIHKTLEEPIEAIAYHRRVVEVCQAANRPIQDYAKSCIEVADYELRTPNGDLMLAQSYLEYVASSNSEEVQRATELLKMVRTAIHNAQKLMAMD